MLKGNIIRLDELFAILFKKFLSNAKNYLGKKKNKNNIKNKNKNKIKIKKI